MADCVRLGVEDLLAVPICALWIWFMVSLLAPPPPPCCAAFPPADPTREEPRP